MAHFSVSNLTPPILTDAGVAPWASLDVHLARGDVLLVRGASGCGKTTLLKCLAAQLPLDTTGASGEVRLKNKLPTDMPQGAYRARVSYIAQHPPRLPDTPFDFFKQVLGFAANADVREGLAQAFSSDAEATGEALEEEERLLNERTWNGPGWRLSDATLEFEDVEASASMTSSLASLSKEPNAQGIASSSTSKTALGLGFPTAIPLSTSGSSTPQAAPTSNSATLPSKPVSYALPIEPWTLAARHWALPEAVFARTWAQLSGGEVARAALAIGLSLQARRRNKGVLLLDEPTSALDDATTRAVEDTLLLSQPKLTIIMITHSDEQARRIVSLARSTDRWVGILRLGEGRL